MVVFEPRHNNHTGLWEVPCLWINPTTGEEEELATLVELDDERLFLNFTVHSSFNQTALGTTSYRYLPGQRQCSLILPFNNIYPSNKGNIKHNVIIKQPALRMRTEAGDVPQKADFVRWNKPEFVLREDEKIYTVLLNYPTFVNTATITEIRDTREYINAGRRNSAVVSSIDSYITILNSILVIFIAICFW